MIKLCVSDARDLATALDSIPQADLASIGDVRKANSSVDAIQGVKEVKTYTDALAELDVEIQKAMKPYEDKISKAKDEEKQAIVKKANIAIKPLSERLEKMKEKAQKDIVEIKLDSNYESFIKTNFEQHIRKLYVSKDAMLRVCDAFDIT